MIDKIKTLLDSGCYVEVETRTNIHRIIGIDDFGIDFIDNRLGNIYLYDEKITSIKPIARPLYNYKVGDKVVVLDNYHYKPFHGKIGTITTDVETEGYEVVEIDGKSAIIDARCIAPYLD